MPVNFFPEGSEGGGGVIGDYIPLTQKGVASGVATLDSAGKVPQSQLPNISITETYVVASEAEMLALTAQKGDVAVRTDSNQTFILQNPPATTLGNWIELGSPSESPVVSVDGMIGAVSLTNTYQAKSNELTGLSALTDTPGFIKKIGDGIYAIDTNTYLTTTLANTTYQPLHANLTSISGITTGTGLLEKTAGGWQLSTLSYQPLHAHLTSISNLTGDGYLEKVGTSWFLRTGGPFQPLDADLTAIAALTADGTLIKSGGVWSMSTAQYQPLNNELSGFSALADTVGLVKKTGDGTYVLDTNEYLTTTLATTTYQPLNANLTGISGLVGTSGVPKLTEGVWSLDATAYLTQNEVITLSGDVIGSGRTAITTTLATIGAGGTFPKITYNTKGLVTGGSILTASDIPALDWSKITTGKPTTIAGYGITDAYTKTEVDASLATKQPLSNELTALSALPDTAGLIRKTGDGTYTIDNGVSFTVAGNGLTSTGNTINAVGTAGRIVANLDSIDLATVGTAGTYTKVTTDAYGRVSSGTSLVADDIPPLDASKIASGTISDARLSGNYTGLGNLSGTGTVEFASFKAANPATWDTGAGTIIRVSSGGLRLNGIPDIEGGVRKISVSGNFMAGIPIAGEPTSLRPLTWNTMVDNQVYPRWMIFPGVSSAENGTGIGSDLTFRAYLDDGVTFYNWIRITRSSGVANFYSTTPSTSTTTGAVVVSGGIGADHVFANLFNGHHQLKTYTTATRPTPSASTLGQIWLNTTTGKIEYVATTSTIQSITSA